jgi:hypothetical protein
MELGLFVHITLPAGGKAKATLTNSASSWIWKLSPESKSTGRAATGKVHARPMNIPFESLLLESGIRRVPCGHRIDSLGNSKDQKTYLPRPYASSELRLSRAVVC